jgi:hypothetical protein
MAAAPCGRCGGLAPVGATFCPFCGASLRAPVPHPPLVSTSAPGVYVPATPYAESSTGSTPTGPSPFGYSGGFAPAPRAGASSPETREADLSALSYVWWAAVVVLCSDAVSFLVFLLPASTSTVVTGAAIGSFFHFGTAFYLLVLGSGVLSIVNVLLLRAAFGRLSPVDGRFSTPRKLALVLLIGVVVALIGLAVFIQALQQLGSCIVNANGTFSGSCGALGNLALGELILLPGAILVLVGYLGCLLGIWRFGIRYQEGSFKVGTILLLIPLVSVAGAVLLLIAASNARSKLGRPSDGVTRFP